MISNNELNMGSQILGYDESVAIFEKIGKVMTSGLEDGTKFPGNESEIQKVRSLIKNANATGCEHEDIKNQISSYEQTIVDASRVSFTGSKFFLGATFFIVIISFWFSASSYQTNAGMIKIEAAQKTYDTSILIPERNIFKLEKRLKNIVARIEKTQKKYPERDLTKELEQLKQTKLDIITNKGDLVQAKLNTPEKIMAAANGKALQKKKKSLYYNLYLICLPFLYYFSARMPFYMQVRRKRWLKMYSSGQRFVQIIFNFVMGLAMATPNYIIKTTYSDGGVTTENDPVGSYTVTGILIFTVLVLYYLIAYVLPLIIIINLYLNYISVFFEKRKLNQL